MASKKEKRHERVSKKYDQIINLLQLPGNVLLRWESQTKSDLLYAKLKSNETLIIKQVNTTICDHKCIIDVDDLYPCCYKKCQIKWNDNFNYMKEEYRCSHYCAQKTCSVGTWLVIEKKYNWFTII